MTKLKTTNNYNFKGSDKLQEVIKSKEYQKYKKEQDLKLQIAATKKLSKESSQRALTQAINLLSSLKRVGRDFECLSCDNRTSLWIQGGKVSCSIPSVDMDCLTSYKELEIVVAKKVSTTNLESIQEFKSSYGVFYKWVPLTKVLELIKDNSE